MLQNPENNTLESQNDLEKICPEKISKSSKKIKKEDDSQKLETYRKNFYLHLSIIKNNPVLIKSIAQKYAEILDQISKKNKILTLFEIEKTFDHFLKKIENYEKSLKSKLFIF